MKLQKILPTEEIANEFLRNRINRTPLEKTANHMFFYAFEFFYPWLLLLTPEERNSIREYFFISEKDWNFRYMKPFSGRS